MSEETVIEAPATPAATPAEGGVPAQNAAESAPAPEAKPGETPAAPTEDPTGKRESRRFERRIAAAYRREAEAKAKADHFERLYQEAHTKQQPAPQDGPKLADYNYDEVKYREAVEEHASEKTRKEEAARRNAEAGKQYVQRVSQEWGKKVSAVGTKYPDFAEVAADVTLHETALYALMEADNGPDIAYYLGTHDEEAERIAALSIPAQIRAIGRLEAKLAAEPPKPKTPSQAPAPITPISGTKTSEVSTIKDGMAYADFVKVRNRQLGRSQ